MKEQLRTEAEKRNLVYAKKINDSELTGLIDISKNQPKVYCFCTEEVAKEILDFHAQQLEKDNWVSVSERLPTEKDADEFGKVLLFRINNDAQSKMPKTIHPYEMVKHCDKDTFWQPLPKSPSNTSRHTT